MKFESSLRPQAGISYVSLGSVLLLALFLFLLASRISEQLQIPSTVVKKEIPVKKKITSPSQKSVVETPKEQKPAVQELKQEPEVVKNEKKSETKRTVGRELGFDLDFGAEQARIIKNFVLPEAKNAGSGRVILKFRFTIRPDGSVAKVFPIMKGNPDLELEAMNLLRKWRFEKLPKTDDQIDQKVEISFRPQ